MSGSKDCTWGANSNSTCSLWECVIGCWGGVL